MILGPDRGGRYYPQPKTQATWSAHD